MEVKELTCIGCPLGCALTVEMEGGSVVSVSGNTCKRGDDYARKEMTDPRRIVTSTVRVKGGILPVVSVKTEVDIPKNLIKKCLEELKGVEVTAPVSIGDVVLKDAAGTGISVVATKNITLQKG
jgi:CxxC motif-containing protein